MNFNNQKAEYLNFKNGIFKNQSQLPQTNNINREITIRLNEKS
ncbi:MAG: hypothetical protein ACI83W_002375 [Marinoscillum sp.]|jgi:hypothetical protein